MRQREGAAADAIPPAVELVLGDIGETEACKRAVQGVDKVRPDIGWERRAQGLTPGCCYHCWSLLAASQAHLRVRWGTLGFGEDSVGGHGMRNAGLRRALTKCM